MRRPWLLPLAPVYGAGLWVARLLEGEAKRLAWPVVSVGSLSAGGAGKTPVVMALADLLGRHGYAADVLSRGYGRDSDAVKRVDPNGDVARFGDEPLMMARAGVPVYVGADRYAAGLLAEAEAMSQGGDRGHPEFVSQPKVHLLDDGFQHRRLARALDVVLLTKEDVADWLLPVGNLREPLERLRAAGVVVLREEEAKGLLWVVRKLAGEVPVWVARRRLRVEAVGGRVVAFCGIARPEGFFAMLRSAGVEPVGTMAFSDHHAYGEQDMERLRRLAQEKNADGFVTTEKDAVKLTREMRERSAVARLEVELLEEAAVLAEVAAHLQT